MPRIARKSILEKFQAMIVRREPIIGGGAGIVAMERSAPRPCGSGTTKGTKITKAVL